MASRPLSTGSENYETAPNTPGPHTPLALPDSDLFLDPPRASYLVSDASTPRDSYALSTPNNSSPLLPAAGKAETYDSGEDLTPGALPSEKRPAIWRWLAWVGAIIIVILAVVLPIYFTVIKPRQNHVNASKGTSGTPAGNGPVGSGSGNPHSPSGATSGGDGSVIITDTGSNFTYSNKFGGFCE